MARPLRIQVAGGYYHVTARANPGLTLFHDDADCRNLLKRVGQALDRYDWRCLAYCLMRNHYHLLIRTVSANLALGMRHINGVYAQDLHRRHGTRGHLFDKRYGAVLVERETHLLEVARYIALNPVRAGLCRRPDEWAWSSHRAAVGGMAPGWLSIDELVELFAAEGGHGRRRYAEFVADGVVDVDVRPTGVVLGTSEFERQHVPECTPSSEIPRRQWGAVRPTLPALLQSDHLDAAIFSAYRDFGYRMKEIAEELGCHYSTVSRRVQRHEGGTDVALQDLTPRVPLRNRVTPYGEIVAIPERGTLMGNRGVMHADDGEHVRDWQVRRWIACRLEFKGRRRAVRQPRRWTELFFLDEATAIAAGHRPCAECRREDYRAGRRRGRARTRRPDAMDLVLHADRLDGTAKRDLHGHRGELPPGVMVEHDGEAVARHARGPQSLVVSGYGAAHPCARRGDRAHPRRLRRDDQERLHGGGSPLGGVVIGLTAAELSRLIAARELSCAELMAATLDRIDAVNPRDQRDRLAARPRRAAGRGRPSATRAGPRRVDGLDAWASTCDQGPGGHRRYSRPTCGIAAAARTTSRPPTPC